MPDVAANPSQLLFPQRDHPYLCHWIIVILGAASLSASLSLLMPSSPSPDRGFPSKKGEVIDPITPVLTTTALPVVLLAQVPTTMSFCF
ncbi:hypothetical protein FRB95_011704 [Tulasnella sp. JGI-2019a]|nr:hypothetical protein FRB95_011704 [Tulasnella sp. JGI-2019a]